MLNLINVQYLQNIVFSFEIHSSYPYHSIKEYSQQNFSSLPTETNPPPLNAIWKTLGLMIGYETSNYKCNFVLV